MRALTAITCLALSACLPTLHTARIDPGLRLDAGLTLLDDQPRDGRAQGTDGLLTVTPVYGFRDRFEIGVPFGVYWEEGPGLSGALDATRGQQIVLLPYVKFALLPSGRRDHLALFGQAAYILPASIGLRYGRDLGRWEPHVGLSWIFSGGPAGDSPVVTRYQQEDQALLLASFGATLFIPGRPVVEMGVLRNSYSERDYSGSVPATVHHTFYDFFVGVRVGTSR